MHNAISCHPLTNAQSVPKQWQHPQPTLPTLSFNMKPCGMGYPFGQFRSVFSGSVPSHLLVHTNLLPERLSWQAESPWLILRTAHKQLKQLKHHCLLVFINIVSLLNPKQLIILTTSEKINSILTKPGQVN